MHLETITWKTVTVRLGDLKPWAENPKTITKAAAKRLLTSWQEYGQVQTIAVSPSLVVLDGHQRLNTLLAAYGSDYVIDARQASRELSEDEQKRLVVLLHAGAVGAWDWDSLSGWSAPDLMEWGMDSEALAGWKRDVSALGNLLESEKSTADAEPQVDRAAELLEKWQVKPGDLWRIGDHRLLCGDSTKREDVERVMGGEKAGAVVTDPPYGQNQVDVPGDEPENNLDLLIGCANILPVENGIVIAFQSPRTFPNWLQAMSNYKFLRSLWLYKEAQMANPWRGWILKSEMILMHEIGTGEWIDAHPFSHDCYKLSEVSFRTEKIAAVRPHGSVKPLSVVQDLVSRVGGLVYEPFCGSGTTMVACENLHRRCRAIEISPAYCSVILERMATAFPELTIERIE